MYREESLANDIPAALIDLSNKKTNNNNNLETNKPSWNETLAYLLHYSNTFKRCRQNKSTLGKNLVQEIAHRQDISLRFYFGAVDET